MGKVIGIATRPKTKAPMEKYSSAKVTFDKGVAEDSRGKFRNHRQVTVLTKEGWNEACSELNVDLDWTTRRANFFVEGIDLKASEGKNLKIGTVELAITGELVPCNRMDEQHYGLTQALVPNWRGGVTCRLIAEGEVQQGDEIVFC